MLASDTRERIPGEEGAVALQARRRRAAREGVSTLAIADLQAATGERLGAVGPRPGHRRARPRRARPRRPRWRRRRRGARRRPSASRGAIRSASLTPGSSPKASQWPVRSKPGSGSSSGSSLACVVAAVVIAGSAFLFLLPAVRHPQRHRRRPPTASSSRSRRASAARSRSSSSIARATLTRADSRRPRPRPTHASRRTSIVMAFNPEEERIVRVTLPFWLLRLKSRHAVDRLQRQADGSRRPQAHGRRPRTLRPHPHRRPDQRGRHACPRLVAVTVPSRSGPLTGNLIFSPAFATSDRGK